MEHTQQETERQEKDLSLGNEGLISADHLSERDIRMNMILFILLGSTFWTGWADLQLALQPFFVYLSASNTIIGIIAGAPFMALFGVFVSPWITKYFRYKKKYVFVANIPYLGMLLLLGLAAIFSAFWGISNSALLMWVLGLMLAHWFFAGFVNLPAQEYLAACIPMSHRGRMTGYSFSIGGIASVGSAALGGIILAHYSKPAAFGYVILLAWLIMQGGYLFALFAKELPTPVEKSPEPWSWTMFKAAWNDKPFVRFTVMFFTYTCLINQTFIFINIYGFKELKMPAETAAIIALVHQICRICLSIPLGYISDLLKPKRVLPYSFILAAVALILPIFIRSSYGVYIAVGFASVFGTLICSAQTALLMGIPSPENRSGHYSLQLVAQNASMAIGPTIMGLMCDLIPYRTAFAIMGCVALVMIPFCIIMLKPLPDDSTAYS